MGEENSDQEVDALYAGRWVAKIGKQIIGQGGTPEQAMAAAQAACFKETPTIQYISTMHDFILPELVTQISSAVPQDIPIYLVGGAVRDTLLKLEIHDLDFVLPFDSMRVGKIVAAHLNGAYYPLDEKRQTSRVITTQGDGKRWVLDFSLQRGETLQDDLIARDFTINSIAIDIHHPVRIFDPLAGKEDLLKRILRVCTPFAIKDDPVRILRGLRLAADYSLSITPETQNVMRLSVDQLVSISPERLRDEIFRILGGSRPAAVLRAMDMIGAFSIILPEIGQLKGVHQSAPHTDDVFQHTLATINYLETILNILSEQINPDSASNFISGLLSDHLGRFRKPINKHISQQITFDRSVKGLLFLAALYHDVGKSKTQSIDQSNRIRFIGHEQVGAECMIDRGRAWNLSNYEIGRLTKIVRNHMRPFHLAHQDQKLSPRVIYRYFRDTESCGVDICILALADILGIYGSTISQEIWGKYLDVIRDLLQAWWEHSDTMVKPRSLVTGDDLISVFNLKQSPLIGELLERVKQEQVEGLINNRDQALKYVAMILKQ